MLTQEYVQLVKALKEDDLRNFTNQFFLCKYKGNSFEVNNTEWPNTYIMTINKNGKGYLRFVHISNATENLASFIDATLMVIAKQTAEKVYRKLECLCLSQIENKEEIIENADLEYGIAITIYDLDAIGKAIEENKALRDFLISVSSKVSSQPAKFNTKDKILYDLFTTGNKIADYY